MRRLELALIREPRRNIRAGAALLAVALAFAGDLAFEYEQLTAEIARKESQLARAAETQPRGNAGTARGTSGEEIAVARDTIRRLSMPWGNLFDALEEVSVDGVALLAIEPDTDAGTVLISGEAKNYLAVLNYLAVVSGAKSLHEVHLVHHENRQAGGAQTVFYSISAVWRNRA